MTSDMLIGFLVGCVYIAGAIAAGRVAFAAKLRYSGEKDKFGATVSGVFWPFFAIIVGLIITLTGNAGIFDSAAREKSP